MAAVGGGEELEGECDGDGDRLGDRDAGVRRADVESLVGREARREIEGLGSGGGKECLYVQNFMMTGGGIH